jgi:hypothetical protein
MGAESCSTTEFLSATTFYTTGGKAVAHLCAGHAVGLWEVLPQ